MELIGDEIAHEDVPPVSAFPFDDNVRFATPGAEHVQTNMGARGFHVGGLVAETLGRRCLPRPVVGVTREERLCSPTKDVRNERTHLSRRNDADAPILQELRAVELVRVGVQDDCEHRSLVRSAFRLFDQSLRF